MTKQFLLDIDKGSELPEYDLILTKMNGEPLQELDVIENLTVKKHHSNIDEISFDIPFHVVNNKGKQIQNELFNLVDGSTMVKMHYRSMSKNELTEIDGAQYFILTKPVIKASESTGEINKTIQGFSREYELAQKTLAGYDATSRALYDRGHGFRDGLEVGFLNYIENNTSWSVKHIDEDLLTKFRHLQFSKSTYLQAFQEVQKTFDCIFQFDTVAKTISAYEPTSLGSHQGLYISDKNFIRDLTQTVDHDEIKTRLSLYGRDNISIQSVSITGRPYIENFDFYKSTEYMSEELINALDSYEGYVETRQGEFEEHLDQLEVLGGALSEGVIELRELESQLRIIQSKIDAAIASDQPLSSLKTDETEKVVEIKVKNSENKDIEAQISDIKRAVRELGENTSLNSHFTDALMTELDPFIKEDEYRDNNYTEDNLQELYEEGKKVLGKISYPRLQFDVSVEDFRSLVEGQHIQDKLQMSDFVTLEHEGLGFDYDVRLVGYEHTPSRNNLKLIFSNKESVDDASIYLKDLLNSLTTTASAVDFSRFKWDKGEDASNEFREYINHELDLANQAISKAGGQKPILDERGLWLYKENPDGSINQEQIRAINNVIAVTKDNWNTVDVAITPDGVKASLLMGKVILGANLKIVSDNGIVEILNNLISIRDEEGRLRVALGNYAPDKYGLLIKDKTGNKTVLDEDGMLQSWQEGAADNVDVNSPLVLNLYIPENTLEVRQTLLRFKMLNFRAYSKTTDSAGFYADTTGSGGSIYQSSLGGGSIDTTTGSKVQEETTSKESKVETETSRIDNPTLVQEWVRTRETDGHTHEFLKTMRHEHSVTIPAHTHKIIIPSHTHTMEAKEHVHQISVDSHQHSVSVPSHSHEIAFGIHTGASPRSIRVRINGSDRTSSLGGGSAFRADANALNITEYVEKGRWNTIELIPDGLGRVDATVFNQVLMGFN